MLKWYRGDLHVHTVLSPCAELEMGPKDVIKECQRLGIVILGITDHNRGANIPAFMEVGREAGITIVPGMEIQTREEVHLLSLFPDYSSFLRFEEVVLETLPFIPNREEIFGLQLIVDKREEIIAYEERLLLVSSSLGIPEVVDLVKREGGMVIPSHINRQAYGILMNLGFIPPDSGFVALEIYDFSKKEEILKRYPDLIKYPLIASSDAHGLEDLDREWITYFYLQEPLFLEIERAFAGVSGRRVVVVRKDEIL